MQVSTLTVSVLEARGLPKTDVSGSCDPYVVLELAPQKYRQAGSRDANILQTIDKQKFTTQEVKNNQNPKFNEEFKFKLLMLDEPINFFLYDKNAVMKDQLVGKFNISLETLPPDFEMDSWCSLGKGKGELRVKLLLTKPKNAPAASKSSWLSPSTIFPLLFLLLGIVVGLYYINQKQLEAQRQRQGGGPISDEDLQLLGRAFKLVSKLFG